MNLLLDSTILIDVLRDRRGRRQLLFDLAMRGDRLASASINVGEIYGGLLSREEIDAEALFESLYIYPLTTSVARDAGRLQFAWARRGKTLDLADMIVAATALEYGLTLMTDNRKDFPMPELKFVDLP